MNSPDLMYRTSSTTGRIYFDLTRPWSFNEEYMPEPNARIPDEIDLADYERMGLIIG